MPLGEEIGLAIAVGVSLLLVVYESVYPRTVVLDRLPGTSLYRNIKQYPEAEQYDSLLIVRIDGPLFFSNALTIRDKVRKYKRVAAKELEGNGNNADTGIKFIILDLSPVSHIDMTALHVLEDMYITRIVGAVSGVGVQGGRKNVQWLFLANVCVGWVVLFFDATLFPPFRDEMRICLLRETLPSGFFSLFCGAGFCDDVLPYTLLTRPNHGVC